MSQDFFAEYKQLLISLEKKHIEDMSSQEVNHFISGIDLAQNWLNRTIHEREKSNLDNTDYRFLLKKLSDFKPKLEKVVDDKVVKEQIERVYTSAKNIHLFLSVDADEKLRATFVFPKCQHTEKIDLLKIYESSKSDHRSWLHSLEALLEGRLDTLSFGISCPKCRKTSLEIKLFIDPKKVIHLARLGKIQVR